jgi:O-antigen/teichoic acid export membrane protein
VSRRWKLVALALPLGAVTTLTSINLNMPRYFIQAHMGEHELGIFSAMAYATVAMTLISDSLGHCAIPRMSRLYAAGQYTEFRGLLLKLLIAAGAIGIAGLFVAQAAGARLLTIVYSKEYAAYASVFVVLMLATAMHFVASMLTCGITSARQFAVQVPLFLAAVGANAWACARWVPSAGLAGGAMGMVAGAGARLVLAAIVVAYLLLRPTGGVIGRLGGWELSL